MMTSSNGNIFRVTGHLCGEFTGPRYRSPVNYPHKGQWRGALMFPLICVGINGWINNREAGDLRRYCAHYDVSVMDHIRFWWHRTCIHSCMTNALLRQGVGMIQISIAQWSWGTLTYGEGITHGLASCFHTPSPELWIAILKTHQMLFSFTLLWLDEFQAF